MWTPRLLWLTLPLTVGSACADALSEWPRAPSTVAAALLWSAWTAGLVALLSPRPWAFTVLRVTSTAAVLAALLGAPGRAPITAAASLAGAVAAAASACSSTVAHAAANAVSRGGEQRFPLRAPTPVAAVMLPLACSVVVACVATGPLLLSAGVLAGGVAACAGGLIIAGYLLRSIHSLARRWVLSEPAGIVVSDPLGLAEPVLLPRGQIESVHKVLSAHPPPDSLDLRLGTLIGAVEMRLREPVTFAVHKRGGAAIVDARAMIVTPLRPNALLAASNRHRIAVV